MADRPVHRSPAAPREATLRPPVRRESWPVTLIVLATLACSGGGDAAGNLDVVRATRGDTTVVRTLSGSAWSGPGQLVEEVRIGTLEGTDEEMFGAIQALAPDGDGGVYVFDGHAPALRHYDADGEYTHTLGGQGGGPGEYRDVALALQVLDDGRVFMRDPRNSRINVYAPSGEPIDHWPVASGLYTSRAMVVDTAGHAYLKILTGRPERNEPWPIGLLHLDAAGAVVDTVHAPAIAGDPQSIGFRFEPTKLWEMSPTGDVGVGVNESRDGRYAFEIRRRDGSVLRVEKARDVVPVHPDEHAELEAINDWTRRNEGDQMTAEIPDIPGTKPAYRGFLFDEAGRIWVHLHVSAVRGEASEPVQIPGIEDPRPGTRWREPIVFDVFEADGTYLGQVDVPERTNIYAIRGDEVWAVQRGELDEPYAVRYRLETGVAEEPGAGRLPDGG